MENRACRRRDCGKDEFQAGRIVFVKIRWVEGTGHFGGHGECDCLALSWFGDLEEMKYWGPNPVLASYGL